MRRRRDTWMLALSLIAVHALVAAAMWYIRKHFEIATPRWIWALAVLPVLSAWYIWRRDRRHARATLSTLRSLQQGPFDRVARLRHVPFLLTLLSLGGMVVAMSRPQSKNHWSDETHEGIDIMIAMDFSASMLAKDFKPNRLEAARNVAMRFIDERPNDRIGLVVYEGEAFTQCPLTTDHVVLNDLFRQARGGLIAGGTAVGAGLATAVNRLRESDGKSKVIILLTDGVSNQGTIQPLDAAQIAEQMGMRVYTIGVGTMGKALSPAGIYPDGQYKYDYQQVEIDDAMLQQVADMTGGKYFRATDERKLEAIYNEIDKLEKTRTKVTEYSRNKEEYFELLLGSVVLFLFAQLLGQTVLRTTP